ncbi:helix-turn-helix transcriptional regulator [Aquella oligotrophica]|uniref:Uncharacterized protein n=1 Tax=Aquella oligotrophica TaxID=2067065 RepID=A0A2I7N918_9NEIS|nr:hypothetical protein [Aquella oligotrophica]AUR52957.1 hypothetical protein CUN60_11840 [Aquella oligotrophica]
MEYSKQNLSDADFFELYCQSADVIYNGICKEVVFIKDSDFIFRYVSNAYKDGLNPNGSIAKDLIHGANSAKQKMDTSLVNLVDAQDELIKTSLKAQNYLYVDIYKHIGLIRKRPIINPSTNGFVGILGVVRPFMLPNVLDIIYKINSIDLEVMEDPIGEQLKYELTPRQHIVLFFYVNKYSYSEIASILTTLGHKISAGRVNDHLENLKYIFAVKTKNHLIEKAIKLKYHLFVPRELLRVGSYALDDTMIISEL